MIGLIVVAILGPFALSVLATSLVRKWAKQRNFVDWPGGHKQHDGPVALGGGIALMIAICVPVLFGALAAWLLNRGGPPDWLPEFVKTHLPGAASRLPQVLAVIFGAIVLHVVGLIDDNKPLGPGVKFLAQFAVALFIAWPMKIRAMEHLSVYLAVPFSAVWIVLITNAFNFLDNMDGLSAGVAAIAATVFSVAAMTTGQVFVPVLGFVLTGALAGFLIFNFSPASIFMGDAGSLVIGYLIGVLTILTTYFDPSRDLIPLGILVPVVALAVPLYDVTSVLIHRIRLGENPLRGDRRHFSHRLVRRGMSTRGAVLTIYLATAATSLPAIVMPRLDWGGAILLLIQCLCVVVMIAVLEHAQPRKRRR